MCKRESVDIQLGGKKDSLPETEIRLNKKKINFFPLILFFLGFSNVFFLFGASASFLGQTLLQNSEILIISAGINIIIFSLQLIGIINIEGTFWQKFKNSSLPG